MSTSLKDFKEYQLYPALWNRIPEVFPDMDFKMTGGYWKSSRHLDGSPSQSPDKTFIHHRRKDLIKENGGEALSLVDFEMMRTGSDFIDALRSLADKCGLTLPDSDTEEYKAYMEKQKNRKEAEKRFEKALFSGTMEANEVLEYLIGRGFSKEEIEKAGFGYIDTQIKNGLPDSSEFNMYSVGTTHRLVIPTYSGSRLLGFKFRDIHHKKGDKGRKYMNTKGQAKASNFYGIGCGVKEVTIVEGEFDSIFASLRGTKNVVATTGGEASREQIKDAIKRGVKKFTLLFDTDEAGRGFTKKTIDTIKETGVSVLVAELPEGYNDTADYLKEHTIEEWDKIVTFAIPSYIWEFNQKVEEYGEICEENGGSLPARKQEDFFEDFYDIINHPSMKPYDRSKMYTALRDLEEYLHFKVEDIRPYADRAFERQLEKDRKRKAEEAVGKAQDLLNEGRTDEALRTMKDSLSKIRLEDRGTRFAKIFASPTPSEVASMLSEIREGLPTGYEFNDGKHREKLELNAGLTFICGSPGHGKTTLLNNIALHECERILKEQTGESVVYFSYEVDKRKLLADFINTYTNDPKMSSNPLLTIQSYFRGKDFFRNETYKDGLTHFEYFVKKKDEFIKDYISTGTLTIVDETFKVEELLDAIKFYVSTRKVSLICLDYVQLVYCEGFTKSRTEEIKAVVNQIKDFANQSGLPFLCAAQFNRDILSPSSLDMKSIGESGDLERVADTIVGIYNLKELKPLPQKYSKEEENTKKILMKLFPERMPSADLDPMPDYIFARLLKRRYGYYPIDTVFRWTGSTKFVESNLTPDRGEVPETEKSVQNIMSGFVTAREEDTQEKLPF